MLMCVYIKPLVLILETQPCFIARRLGSYYESVPDLIILCQEAVTWPSNIKSLCWYDQDVPQHHVGTGRIVVCFHGHSHVVSLTADSGQSAGQQIVHFGHDNIYWPGLGWQNTSGYVSVSRSADSVTCFACHVTPLKPSLYLYFHTNVSFI